MGFFVCNNAGGGTGQRGQQSDWHRKGEAIPQDRRATDQAGLESAAISNYLLLPAAGHRDHAKLRQIGQQIVNKMAVQLCAV